MYLRTEKPQVCTAASGKWISESGMASSATQPSGALEAAPSHTPSQSWVKFRSSKYRPSPSTPPAFTENQ